MSAFGSIDRGLLSQNILSQLRNLIEACMVRLQRGDGSISFSYYLVKDAKGWVKAQNRYKFLADFHDKLQVSDSHYTLSEDASERLMLSYLSFLYKTRNVMNQVLSVSILSALENYPINQALQAPYREAIAQAVESASNKARIDPGITRYYVWRSTPFFVHGRVYYEITLTPARDKPSNTDHFVAYTSFYMLERHAIQVTLSDAQISVGGIVIPVTIITCWKISIRPCELECMAKILRIEDYTTTSRERGYRALMNALMKRMSSMLDLARLEQPYYTALQLELSDNGATKEALLVDTIRQAITPGKPGATIVSYLALGMRHGVLKQQYDERPNSKLSNLRLQYGCISFDEMPFCSNPLGHIPHLSDVLACVSYKGREHELLDAQLIINAERDGVIFTPMSSLPFDETEKLRLEFNSHIYSGHKQTRSINCHHNHLYIQSYANDTIKVLGELFAYSKGKISGYSNQIETVLSRIQNREFYSQEKIEILKCLFASSRVAAVYGSAGTGKSTFISLVASTTQGQKLFLAYTHSAVENLERRVGKQFGEFSTIDSFIWPYGRKQYTLVVIDECSTVPNEKMRKVLERVEAERLLLVGDECQIGSIRFGNWFEMCRRILPTEACFTLEETYRTSDESLLKLWQMARTRDSRLAEFISTRGFASRLGPEVFHRTSENEVVLCLSYNGLYGVNNINRILQLANPNPSVTWQHLIFKVGDPIVFGDTRRFLPHIHNNSKGIIRQIEKREEQIVFDIEVRSLFTSADGADFRFLGNPSDGTTLVRINVFKGNEDADDDFDTDTSKTVIPFQVAYAMSIHKAQGLEYNSVKLVIPSEVDDLISHDIFYTAITRAKQHLMIFWEPESQTKVLGSFDEKDRCALTIKKELVFLTQIAQRQGALLSLR